MNLDFFAYWRWWRGLACAVVLPTVTGCIVLPVPVNYHTHGSRRNVRVEKTPWLVPGQTTREEVVLRLGEPDEIDDHESKLVYRWEKIYLQIWVAVYNSGGRTDFGKDYALELTFDLHGALTNYALQKSGFETKAGHTL